jgi:uncharacterized protein (TIGR01244 family)
MIRLAPLTPCVVLFAAAVSAGCSSSPVAREAHWAATVDLRGVPNLHQVSPTLYRSAQPTDAGMLRLREFGITTVVNLRSFHSDRAATRAAGLDYEHLYLKAWHPEHHEAVAFLRFATDPARQPLLVHCQHGADRTGAMVALYRVAVEGWTMDEAIREMTNGGYRYHAIWKNLPRWLERQDIDQLRREAGIKTPVASLLGK